jgi:LytS/YehU family sensor histidine kinase
MTTQKAPALPNLAVIIGLLLVIAGFLSYLLAGATSLTALIPAFLGGLLALLGYLGQRQESMRRHAMHAAAAVALLGLLGTLSGVVSFFVLLSGGFVLRPFAVTMQALTAVLCAVFLFFAVRSFVQARRWRSRE